MDQVPDRYDVFISYSHLDSEKHSREIQQIKEQIEHDLRDIACRRLVFLDSEALACGEEWQTKIKEKLNECRVFICLLSENYLKSSYCTRERLWWEQTEIRRGHLRQSTLPVYFICLDRDPYKDERQQVQDLFGFQMELVEGKLAPWFDRGMEDVKNLYLTERIEGLKNAVRQTLGRVESESGFNSVFPYPSVYFVGRILELKKLREICACNQYPIIEGDPGVGKSELATVYSYGYADEYPQGRFLVHMEGIRSWEKAVVSLVRDPEYGNDVRKELGITDEEMQGDDRALHRLIVKKLFERSEKGRLLLVLDNVDDASLFTDQKLLTFSLRQLIPEKIHMIATTRNKLPFPEKCRAVAFPLGNLDDAASFELFCEIGDNRFPFCRKPVLDAANDPEYAAAMEIIHLVEGHVWSMEILAGQIAEFYEDGVSFRYKLDSLRKDLSIENDGNSWRSVANNPAELVRGTLDLLGNNENGDAVVRLAYFAALLAPDGEKTDVLRACWDKFFPNVRFRNRGADSFLPAYNQLWRYSLIHGKDDDRMHRLTQTALKQIMREDGVFDDCVEKLAEAMAGMLSISLETWIGAISSTPEIAVYLRNAHPDFFSKLLSSEAWVKLMSVNPSDLLIGMCPWETLSGLEWENILEVQPQFADKCPWNKIVNWVDLLPAQPQFGDKCPWDKLGTYDLVDIACFQPLFADKCRWDKMNVGEWAMLLQYQPDVVVGRDDVPWDELTGFNWSNILQYQPQLASRCEWSKLDGEDWSTLLIEQPIFAGKCPWLKLDGKDWAELLGKRSQFAGKCPWDKLTGENWADLLAAQPQFADKCPWDELTGRDWAVLLSRQPQFADKCPWDKLTGKNWADLLYYQPRFETICPWDLLKDVSLTYLLCRQPQFFGRCKGFLHGDDWSELLRRCPQFAAQCPWNELDGKDWSELLQAQPQFDRMCDWSKLNGEDWSDLLHSNPQFAASCDWSKLNGEDWSKLLQRQPQFDQFCDWSRLNGKDWSDLLQAQPQFGNKCPWDELDGKNWFDLLISRPEFAPYCDWDKVLGYDWAAILYWQPQLAVYCDWNKLDEDDWIQLLSNNPDFADKCPWDIFDETHWVNLLIERPKFADRCPWEKFDGLSWITLLKRQPQFADICPWEDLKLGWWPWVDLLTSQPQLADWCPWDKMDKETLDGIFEELPQFKHKKP